MRPSLGAMLALLLAVTSPAMALVLDLPPGARRAVAEAEPLGTLRLATGPWAEGHLPQLSLEGAVTREVWQVPAAGGSLLGLVAPLRGQIAAEGWKILLDCEAEACGGFDFRAATEVLPPPGMFVDLATFRYLSARRGPEALSLLASRSAGTDFLQILRVGPASSSGAAPEAAPPEAPAPQAVPPAGFAAQIEGEGHVILEGLAFATGSARLAAGSDEALRPLAAYLLANPARRVALVGHTDATGPLEANIALSRRRAETVAERLVSALGVPRAQLEAQGMGWLAPRATNLTPEGREANRRVEAVVLP